MNASMSAAEPSQGAERGGNIKPWVDAFAAQSQTRTPWLVMVRGQALARFADTGWPTLRQDGWRHTPVNAVAEASAQWLAAGGLARADAPLPAEVLAHAQTRLSNIRTDADTDHWLVFVDGVYAPQLSRIGTLSAGAHIRPLSQVLRTDPDAVQDGFGDVTAGTPVMAMNAAFAEEGALIHVAQGVALDAPIHLVFLAASPNRVRFARNLIRVEAHAQATVIEHFIGLNDSVAGLTHTHTHAAVAEGAQLTHAKLQQDSLAGFHLGTTAFTQANDAQVQSHSISLGARLARHDIATRFDGKNGKALLNGLYLIDGKRHIDHHTLIDHAQANNTSQESYRGILDGQSRGVFCGRVLVAPGADRTDAEQRCDSLLLSRLARADTQPELEIYADDVKCAHGATVGQLDEDSLFYLRARGLSRTNAHSVLVYAFAAQALARINAPALKAHASRAVRDLLPGQGTLGDIAWV